MIQIDLHTSFISTRSSAGLAQTDSVAQLQVVSAGQGHCSCKMVVEQEHENRVGFIHGGMVATLVDAVSTAGLMTSDWGAPGVSVELSISWVYIEMIAHMDVL